MFASHKDSEAELRPGPSSWVARLSLLPGECQKGLEGRAQRPGCPGREGSPAKAHDFPGGL